MTQDPPQDHPQATEIVQRYHLLVKTLERLKQEIEETEFFSDTHDTFFEEQRFLERAKGQVKEIQLVVDWYREFA